MEQIGCPFQAEQTSPWLYRSQIGLQNVVVVVCRDLPLEKKYYEWLIFAPSDSTKWREFAKMLIRNSEATWLRKLRELRAEELELMDPLVEEILKEYPLKEQKRRRQALLRLIKKELEFFEQQDSREVAQTLLALEPETLVDLLKSRGVELTTEQIANLTKPLKN